MDDVGGGYWWLLIVTGFAAGVINTLAGGGSNLTIPALMLLGMPADTANATNRVGVFFQTLVAVKGFHRAGKLQQRDAQDVVVPTLLGAVVGALLAAILPLWLLKPLLLGVMVTVALIILVRPSVIAPESGERTFKVADKPQSFWVLLLAGAYGGFIQAGVGFILILAIAGMLRFDLVRTNALKVAATLAFTALSLVVFIAFDLIVWLPGLVLACGTMIGAHIAVKLSLHLPQQAIKWFLFAMTLCASAAALWF